jgi:hypothetical protein
VISAQSRGEEPDDEGGELEAGGEDAHPSLLRESERHERADEEQEEHAETVLGLPATPFQPLPRQVHRGAS